MIRRHKRRAAEGALLEIYRHSNNDDVQTPPVEPLRYPIENISRGGLRFQCSDSYRIDERVELVLHLGNGLTHLAMGRICYRQPDDRVANEYHYGISFLDNILESRTIY